MKHFLLLTAVLLVSFSVETTAQCITDIRYMKDSPYPCHFVGTVAMQKNDCRDFTASPEWLYRWTISEADDGDLLAVYEGPAFDHVFERFGGFEFCLEIHKDGNPDTPADHYECQTYTTCEPCGDTDITFSYVDCPVGGGCNLQFNTVIEAANMVGVKPQADYILTYYPSTVELIGGDHVYELVFPNVDVEYHPETGELTIAEDLNVRFRRGCYKPHLRLELEFGAGAHDTYGGPACTELTLTSEEIFRCIACDDKNEGCDASLRATEIAITDGTCEPFGCWGRSSEAADRQDGNEHTAPGLLLSPNPVQRTLRVQPPPAAPANLTLFVLDARGSLVWQEEIKEKDSTDVDVSALQPGMYLLALRAEGRVVAAEKFAVAR